MRVLRLLMTMGLAISGLLAVPATSYAQTTYPACDVVTTYGTGTLTPGAPAVGRGTGTITLQAGYVDMQNATPAEVDWGYFNSSKYKAGATSVDYSATMTVNSIPRAPISPHTDYGYYWYHGTDAYGWPSAYGGWTPWHKGDVVTIRVSIVATPTMNSGYTQATCTL